MWIHRWTSHPSRPNHRHSLGRIVVILTIGLVVVGIASIASAGLTSSTTPATSTALTAARLVTVLRLTVRGGITGRCVIRCVVGAGILVCRLLGGLLRSSSSTSSAFFFVAFFAVFSVGRRTRHSPRCPMGYPTRYQTPRRRLPRSTSWRISWRSSSSTSWSPSRWTSRWTSSQVPCHRPRPVFVLTAAGFRWSCRSGCPASCRLLGFVGRHRGCLEQGRTAGTRGGGGTVCADSFVADSFVEVSFLSTIGPFSFGAHLRVTDAGAVPWQALSVRSGSRAVRCVDLPADRRVVSPSGPGRMGHPRCRLPRRGPLSQPGYPRGNGRLEVGHSPQRG